MVMKPVLSKDLVNGPAEGTVMNKKFSKDLVTVGDFEINPGRVLKQVAATRRAVLLTIQGRGVAVVQSVAEYEKSEEERAFMRAVVAGLSDLEVKREISIREAKARLGLE
jgi:prevent-host-death family protein